jgi:succinoglycan biosynthesis transport protein ExoP
MAKLAVVSPAPAPASEERLIDPHAIVKLARRRWRPMLITALATLLVAAILYMAAQPQYVATGRLALERRTDQLVDTSVDQGTANSSVVDTQVQVLKSPEIAAAVVDRLKLQGIEGFGVPKDAESTEAGSRERAIRVVQGGLDAVREGQSYAISVSYTADDPNTAAVIANAAMEAYTSGQKSSEYAQRAKEAVLLRDRLGLLRADVIRAEQALARGRASTNLVDIGDTAGAQAMMQALNAQLAQARADEAAASARAAAAASATTIVAPSINSLRTEQARLEAKRAELSERYNASHPSLISVNEQLSAVNRSLEGELARVRQGAIAEAQAARNRAASLRASVGREQSQLMAANNASAFMAELERNAAAARTLYQGLLDEYKTKMVALGTERSNAIVIANAYPPNSPSSPNSTAYLIGGILAALVFGAFAGVTGEMMESGLLNQAMAEKKLGIPFIASIPDVTTVRDSPLKEGTPAQLADHMLEHPDGVFAESFRGICTALKVGQESQLARTLAVTSALVDEGKTTTAICLARTARAAGLRVLLVDCDIRHRSATKAFGCEGATGLMELLQERANLDETITQDSTTGLDVLPTGAVESTKAELLASRSMRFLLTRLRTAYDLVILETAPVLPVAETRGLAAMTDGTLLVVRWRKTPTDVAKRAVDQLERSGAEIIGGLLSRVNIHSSIIAGAGEDVYYYPSSRSKAA